jgi:hypothetical protein
MIQMRQDIEEMTVIITFFWGPKTLARFRYAVRDTSRSDA